jgi:hypothetical protein
MLQLEWGANCKQLDEPELQAQEFRNLTLLQPADAINRV